MRKISIFIAFVALLAASSIVYADKNETAGETSGQTNITASPVGNSVGNQNQIQTQNEGEDSMLQTNTAEKENLGSLVSQKVQDLLDDETLDRGIGQQVKQYIQEQKQIQDQVKLNLTKVASRSGLLKSIIGPDYKALKNANMQLEQNRLRIKNLEELKTQLTNAGDITMVEETIQALVDQNTALQDQINLEENQSSLLGWLIKLFTK
jgi:hypothetical protein